MNRRFAALALAVGLAGCQDITAPQDDGLEAARTRWAIHGPASYDFDFQWLCFCPESYVRLVTISVRDGTFAGIVYADSGTAADTALYRDALTVDRIFAFLERALATGPADYRAIYDTAAGYPHEAFIDYDAQTVDEERALRIEALRPVP